MQPPKTNSVYIPATKTNLILSQADKQ